MSKLKVLALENTLLCNIPHVRCVQNSGPLWTYFAILGGTVWNAKVHTFHMVSLFGRTVFAKKMTFYPSTTLFMLGLEM